MQLSPTALRKIRGLKQLLVAAISLVLCLGSRVVDKPLSNAARKEPDRVGTGRASVGVHIVELSACRVQGTS